ncbi:TMhelix containing protein [Vibrio phage 1.225.O._10N.261.48.B7]|nr:TMhelix containing protein [Vibrio phage 1.225.O._10N.261.48.B7]
MLNKLIGAICTTTGSIVCFLVWCLMFGLVMFAPGLVLLVGEWF